MRSFKQTSDVYIMCDGAVYVGAWSANVARIVPAVFQHQIYNTRHNTMRTAEGQCYII